MPLDLTPRDDAGRPMDLEQFHRLIEREWEQEADVLIRTVPTLGEGVIELAAVSRSGQILVRLSMPKGTATIDDERWLLERGRRLLPAPVKPAIRLLG